MFVVLFHILRCQASAAVCVNQQTQCLLVPYMPRCPIAFSTEPAISPPLKIIVRRPYHMIGECITKHCTVQPCTCILNRNPIQTLSYFHIVRFSRPPSRSLAWPSTRHLSRRSLQCIEQRNNCQQAKCPTEKRRKKTRRASKRLGCIVIKISAAPRDQIIQKSACHKDAKPVFAFSPTAERQCTQFYRRFSIMINRCSERGSLLPDQYCGGHIDSPHNSYADTLKINLNFVAIDFSVGLKIRMGTARAQAAFSQSPDSGRFCCCASSPLPPLPGVKTATFAHLATWRCIRWMPSGRIECGATEDERRNAT